MNNAIFDTDAGSWEIDLTAKAIRGVDKDGKPWPCQSDCKPDAPCENCIRSEWREFVSISNVSHAARAVVEWADGTGFLITLPLKGIRAQAPKGVA